MIRTAALASLPLVAFCTVAAPVRPIATESGFGGEINLNAGYLESTNQFATDKKNEITEDLTNRGQQISKAAPFPLMTFTYTLESLKTQFFMGSSRENVSKGQFQFEFGGRHQFADGSVLEAAYFPELPFIQDTWQDPFVEGLQRAETKEQAQGVRLAWKNVAELPITLRLASAFSRVDSEHSGEWLVAQGRLDTDQIGLLHRDTDFYRGEIEYTQYLSRQWLLKPAFHYTRAEAKGEANSYDAYAFRLSSIHLLGRHTVVVNATIDSRKADAVNPVFDQRQDDTGYGLFAVYNFAEPFGWSGFSLVALAGWGKTDSNIAFYESKTLFGGGGVAYRF